MAGKRAAGDPGGIGRGLADRIRLVPRWRDNFVDPGEVLGRDLDPGCRDCVGHLSAPVSLQKGLSYRLRVRFELSPGLGPHRNLLFCLYAGGFNDGIFDFQQDAGGSYSGEGRFLLGEHGADEGDIRIFFRFAAAGTAWALGIDPCDIASGIARLDHVPGRLQAVPQVEQGTCQSRAHGL